MYLSICQKQADCNKQTLRMYTKWNNRNKTIYTLTN